VITPRRTRLIRVTDLAAFRTTLTDVIDGLAPDAAGDTFVVVPSRAAADELRRTVEAALLGGWSPPRSALSWPMTGTRLDLYEELARRMARSPRALNGFEREVVVASIARQLEVDGLTPPFKLRPALLAEIQSLYDYIRRLGRAVDDFDRNVTTELERDEDDRGAQRLLQQTRFLTALFRTYESRIAATGVVDEHALRDRLHAESLARPIRQVLVTVGDHHADPDGLWPADFDVLTRLPDLTSLDIITTEGMLASGLIERLYAALPDLQEERPAVPARAVPILVHPPTDSTGATPDAFVFRDREEELRAIARRLKADARHGHLADLRRCALIVQRPLPYLYLARSVFGDAGVPFETRDTLPLAAEPYAAAVDLALDAVSADYTRPTLLALLRSPHYRPGGAVAPPLRDAPPEAAVTADSIRALDFALSEVRYLGGLDRLRAFVTECTGIETPASREERRRKTAAPAAAAILAIVDPLDALATVRPMIEQIDTLASWLVTFHRSTAEEGPSTERTVRVRSAILGALEALRSAYQRLDPTAEGDVHSLSATIRRWLGAQTFALPSGAPGLQILDARAARFGDFADVQLVGLVEGDWPERERRNAFYPAALLSVLEPLSASSDPFARERHVLNGARARFKDLVHLASSRVRLSTFLLENDAVVQPTILLDDLQLWSLPREQARDEPARVFQSDALSLEPIALDALPARVAEWAAARLDARTRSNRHRGEAGPWTLPRVSVSRLERYLDCPFRFFSSEVLRLEEQPEDEDTRTPLERGRFLHELFEEFFRTWQQRGHRRITPALLPEARTLFESICETVLGALSPAEAALERVRLLGSAVSPGIAHRVFAMEAERTVEIDERLLEFPLQGEFTFRARDGRSRVVALSAKADRIDLLRDGTLRVIDYKSKKTPELKIALQLPIYSLCAQGLLRRSRGGEWRLAEAAYLSFEGERAVVPLRTRGRTIDELIDDAQERLLTALDDIAAGHFPARPSRKSLCGPCPYATVCRLEYVDDEEAERG
jgi:RecB family exonuclease